MSKPQTTCYCPNCGWIGNEQEALYKGDDLEWNTHCPKCKNEVENHPGTDYIGLIYSERESRQETEKKIKLLTELARSGMEYQAQLLKEYEARQKAENKADAYRQVLEHLEHIARLMSGQRHKSGETPQSAAAEARITAVLLKLATEGDKKNGKE